MGTSPDFESGFRETRPAGVSVETRDRRYASTEKSAQLAQRKLFPSSLQCITSGYAEQTISIALL
jgi:hypothetical protein